MTTASDRPAADVLALVISRLEIIECIANGGTDKRDIEAAVEPSRPTIDRAIRELEGQFLVVRQDGEIRLTRFGRHVYEKFARVETTIDGLFDAKTLLDELPAGLEVGMDALADAEVVVSKPHAPQKPLAQLESLVRESGQQRTGIVLPAITPRIVELIADATESNSATHDLILTEAGSEYFRTALDSGSERLRNRSNFRLWRLPDDVHAGLAVVEDAGAWLGVYDDAGRVRGAFALEEQATIAEVMDQFESMRKRSQGVDVWEVLE